MAWGSGAFNSCNALLERVEKNDPKLIELVILPMKVFGAKDLDRLSHAIESGANTHLVSISASGHHLPPASLKTFGVALSIQAQRKQREQQNNSVDNGGSGVGCSGGIASLAIGSKDMGDEGIIALCEGLSSTNGALLQHLDLGWKQITKDGLYTIGKTFVHSKYMTHLDLSRNDFGSDGIAQLSRAVVDNNHNVDGTAYDDVAFPALEQLILSECNIDSEGMNVLADILLGQDNERIRSNNIHLAIGSNPIGSKGCDALTRLLSSNDAGVGSIISHLQATQCSIGDEGIRILSRCCHNNLEILDISDNYISHEGAEQLAKSLCHSWPDLVELKIAKNDIGSDGVMAILGSMVTRSDKGNNSTDKNDKIHSLDLSYTNCGADGARAALMSGGVSTLRLFGNKIGSEGFQAIAPLLRGGHPNIENLDLGGNNADEDSVVILLDAIAETSGDSPHSMLVVLEIGGNKFGENAMEALNRLKSVWPALDVAHDKPVGESEWKEEG